MSCTIYSQNLVMYHQLKIVTDRETGRSRGFGFVEMGDEEGKQAIEALNQKEFNGKLKCI